MERAKPFVTSKNEGSVEDIAFNQVYISCLDFLENHDPDDEAIDTVFEILNEALKRYGTSDT